MVRETGHLTVQNNETTTLGVNEMNEYTDDVLDTLLEQFAIRHLNSIFALTSLLSGMKNYDTDYDVMLLNFPFLY
jgi:hypothetical protein